MYVETGNDALSLSYDVTKKLIRTGSSIDLVNMMLSNIAAIVFDEIAVSYTSTTDVLALKAASALVSTLTVTYTDATKATVSGIVKVDA